MTDEDVFTYGRTVKAVNLRALAKALKDNSIPHRADWKPGSKLATVYVKPERQRRLDRLVNWYDK